MSNTFIKNATIISMDSEIGNIHKGNILIKNDLIFSIGDKIEENFDTEIDATGMIALPGLINAHHHTWQTAIRGIGGNWKQREYFNVVHANIATHYKPEDIYIGNLIGSLNQINSGTTTIFDWSHGNATPEHTDSAIEALFTSGIRAIFGHGTVKPDPKEGEPHFSTIPHPREEIERLRKGTLHADTELVTLAIAILGPDYSTKEVTLKDFQLAKEFDLLSSAHIWGMPNRIVKEGYTLLLQEGLLNNKHNIVHGNYLKDDEIKLIVDSGASVTSTPVAELQTHGVEPIINKVSNFGGKPSIGSDLEIYSGAGMLDILRSSLRSQRIFLNMKFYEQGMKGEKKSISTREALEWTTINNAIALGMDDRIGSLKPGKKADIILIDGESLNMSSAHNPEQATVMHANESDIRFVLINGKVVKENGKLLLSEEKLNKWKEELKESKKNLMQRSNFNS